MSDDYLGSIAQKLVRLVTSIVATTVPGENFNKVMIFVDHADAATYFVSDPGVDTLSEVDDTNYAQVTKGLLKTWLDGFYLSGSVAKVELVTFDAGSDGDDPDLATQYARFVTRAYWKLAISSSFTEEVNVGLAVLCANDTLSQFVYESHDATILTGVGTEVAWFTSHSPKLDVPIAYHPDVTSNPALVALGKTMAQVNSTGTYVGNKTDMSVISGYSASGAGGINLTPTQYGFAEGLGVAYFTSIGDNSGNVALQKWTTCINHVLIGMRWLVNYIDTVVAIYIAQYMAQEGRYKNNDSYQGCLALLQSKGLNPFRDLGRLSDLKITAPLFANLPPAAGDVITVPTAWEATYVDTLREITIYGTLFVIL